MFLGWMPELSTVYGRFAESHFPGKTLPGKKFPGKCPLTSRLSHPQWLWKRIVWPQSAVGAGDGRRLSRNDRRRL